MIYVCDKVQLVVRFPEKLTGSDYVCKFALAPSLGDYILKELIRLSCGVLRLMKQS